VTERQMRAIADHDEYHVVVDSSLEPGSLTYAEWYKRGGIADEVLISCHVCHPSMCNDNLSGIAVASAIAKQLEASTPRYSYRILFVPGTIGAITWLALNERTIDRVKHGVVLTGVGDPGHLTYKKSRRGDAEVDRAFAHALRNSGEFDIVDFSPYGYDERQYCSPGFNLPVGCLMRTPFGQYAEYHTSDDDLDFVTAEALEGTLAVCRSAFDVLEGNARYVNLNPKCEPQLGRRGLYGAIGGASDGSTMQMALLWVLNLSDGSRSLLDIADRAALPFAAIREAANVLVDRGLLRTAEAPQPP
jgi:aminopeptidase-like protein